MTRSTDDLNAELLARHPYRNAVRAGRPDTIVLVGEHRVPIGGTHVAMIAGPCAVEGRETLLETAHALSGMGVQMLRGGAFKPRTSPHSFQGLGEEGLQLLAEAREATGMAIVTEVLTPEDVPLVARYADVLQVGTRNMANYRLLEALGAQDKPVLLKRGMAATIEELLCAAEYVLAGGNPNVILCERGIRSFEPMVRNAFDLNVIPLLDQLTHLPVIVDPSHAAGRADLVHAVTMGAVAAGAHGFIIEAHENPLAAIVDGSQTLDMEAMQRLITGVDAIAAATGRQLDRTIRTVAA
ncbi:MAG: phospho-2-dehydro-3-deoxyheptonate aldolase [Thermoleophilia bacterium]|nr:phospho-2-dehydro-3-deoxyheptonate aldolase [Thermoleophilia bacterium]